MSGRPEGAPRRVLVVDDSKLARTLVVRHLAREGYELQEAASGEEALELSARTPPDVVLMDVEMPGLGGHETLRRLKLDPVLHEIPVLFITGRTDPVDAAEGLRIGAHDYLRKPFEAIELIARVRAAVELRRLQLALRQRNAELERLAAVDGLTGLFNRRFLEEQAARIASRMRRSGGTMAVVVIDIDAFKAINDTHGHGTGDVVLVEVARRLASCTRLEDLLGRWGGEEFVVLAPDTGADGAAALAERLRAAVAGSPIRAEGDALAVTVSAGWATGHEGTPLQDLFRIADRGLYDAKAGGRNRVEGGTADPG